jgi:8-oxo-dGTP pyrophosphatase MutT (NUDIX family)
VAVTSVRNKDDLFYAKLPSRLQACLDAMPDNRAVPPTIASHSDDRLAAVLVPLIQRQTSLGQTSLGQTSLGQTSWEIVLTKRAAHLSHHAGQISFPGGAVDHGDAGLVDTALREAHEEIGLMPSMVKIMGGLLPVRSPAGFIVQPIVGIIDSAAYVDLKPAPAEVDQIFTVPLAHIGQADNFTLVPRQTDGRDSSYWVITHPDHYIWGLSARVLHDLRERLYDR